MDGVDKEKVQRVVYEMSKGSKYFENEQRKEAFIQKKIEHMRNLCGRLSESDISHFQTVAEKKILELEATCDLSKIWLHVDMDAFYASVEILENPALKGKPIAVGGMSMISTASYEARRYGVRAAMPGFIACKLCPDLIFVPTNFKRYTYYSELTRKVFQKYDPEFIAASLDEAYLNITEVCKERGATGAEIAEELRAGVYEATGLTCSAGVAPNRVLAKVCSDINKPNGQFVLPSDRVAVMTFVSSLPIRKIGGIGKVTESILRDVLGIRTCEEMVQKGAFLCALFSHCSAGKTDTPQAKLRKSMSSERTFSATADETLLFQRLGKPSFRTDIAETLSTDMHKEGLCGRTLTLKVKTASFEENVEYIWSREDILKYATKLLKKELSHSVRLLGLRISQFNDDRLGCTDPSQKTIMDFVKSGNASRKANGGNILVLEINDSNDFLQTYTSCDSDWLSDSDNLSDLQGKCQTVDYAAVDMQRCVGPLEQEDYPAQLENIAKSYEIEQCSSPTQSESNNTDKVENIGGLADDKLAILSCQEEKPFWVDGYKCSFCGIELPPSFIEERREHFDYHLAEMLQKEETMHRFVDQMPWQR
ncbi:hypothetical protein ACLOJK_035977 [Asimina triloba]